MRRLRAQAGILAGLAELCLGLGAAAEEQQVEQEDLQGGFEAEDLERLLQACPDAEARWAALRAWLPCACCLLPCAPQPGGVGWGGGLQELYQS
jgi:hypothetical protein